MILIALSTRRMDGVLTWKTFLLEYVSNHSCTILQAAFCRYDRMGTVPYGTGLVHDAVKLEFVTYQYPTLGILLHFFYFNYRKCLDFIGSTSKKSKREVRSLGTVFQPWALLLRRPRFA